MSGHLQLQPLAKEDCKPAAALLRRSFERRLHPYLPYCQLGIHRYLGVLAADPSVFPGRRTLVAKDGEGRVVGFAEFRSGEPATDLLAYICVDSAARGQRLAERLIRHHLDISPQVEKVVLDVFAENAVARRLYARLGFEQIDASSWWAREIPESPRGHDDRLRVADWHTAWASLHAFGFCMVEAEWEGVPMRVGLPSPTVVRTNDAAMFSSDEWTSALRGLVPTLQRVLLVGTQAPEVANASRVLESMRLGRAVPLASGKD